MTGDFQLGKKYNCPDCHLTNGHPDAVPQINFCAYCDRKNNECYGMDKPQDTFVVKKSHECPWCHKDYIFGEGHHCHVWSKHMRDDCTN